jgi:enoyl-CoA hydratase/carnithine racemase
MATSPRLRLALTFPHNFGVERVNMSSSVKVSSEGRVSIITLSRPEVRNAMDDSMRTTLIGVLEEAANNPEVGAIVITGEGKAFCAGGDVAGMRERLNAPAGEVAFNGWRRQRRTHQSVAALHGVSKPTIAAVNGAAVGLGCDLALSCDFIVVSQFAKFSMSFVQRGLIPDGGGMYFLPRRVGLSCAKELIFSGRTVDAQEAVSIGMADRISAPDRLLEDAMAWAAEMSKGSSTAIALAKAILDRTFETPEEQVFALGREAQAICYTTDEHRNSVHAFLNKTSR